MCKNQDDNSTDGPAGGTKVRKIFYSLREWSESSFLEYAELIMIDTSYSHIQKINLENGEAVYLVPESFYLSKASNITVQTELGETEKAKK